ncbi:MAG TPA: peptide deformylase [Solirubrobacteraceae bacterium]|jgi:peptide deformylase
MAETDELIEKLPENSPTAPRARVAGDRASSRAVSKTDEPTELDSELEQDAEEPPKELDPETRARRDAALRHVRKLGDPVLRASALPVDRFDEALRAEIERMGELMGEALGIGLAATQIGVLHRVLVYRADPDDPLTVLVNPVLEWSSEETEIASEGCLSIPFVHVDVERPAEVRVRARDGHGAELEVAGSGLTARVIQHEMDHLDGILMIDRISREERKEAMRAMREAQREASEPGGERRPVADAGEADPDASPA